MNQILEAIAAVRVLPVIKIENAETTVPLCSALCEGGLPAAEITFRTACAAEAIATAKKNFPSMLVGAGTILSVEQAKKAVDAGAQFIISPGLNPAVVTYCTEHGIPVTPGCVTPTEIEAALGLGLDVVKFFPAEAFGGVKTIKALSAPYRMMKFIPTGGISPDNLGAYLACPAVLACGGSFMVKDSLIAAGDFEAVMKLTKQTAAQIAASQK